MSAPKPPRTTSTAKAISPAPESFADAPKVGAPFKQSRDAAPKRDAAMVRQDRPKPAPRPSPGLAQAADAAAFNARWQAEKDAADKANRRAAFLAKRNKDAQARTVTRSRSD